MTYRKKIEKLKKEIENKNELIKKLNNQIIEDNTENAMYVHIIHEQKKEIIQLKYIINEYFKKLTEANQKIKKYEKLNYQYARTTTKAIRNKKC